MATLFNTKISNTYVGLLKTIDNAVINATLRELTDGSGNQSGLYINTAGDFKATGTLEWGTLKDTGENISITKFVDEAGIPTQIRNYGSDTAPHGRTTKVEVRKTSGRGKTSEGDTRKINEMLATDPTLTPVEKQAFARIMAQAAAEGMDGDHIVEIARVANAVRDMTPAQRKAYFKRFKKAGVALGNDPKNVQKLSKQENQVVKPAQLRAIDKAIQNMDKRGKSLLDEMLSSIQ